MATVSMPQLGESVTEGTILKWLKLPGDTVDLDEPLCEIETEKVTAELPSPFAGTMGRILVAEGDTVEVGAALCEIAEAGVAPVDAAPADQAPAVATPADDDLADLPPPSGNGWSGGPMAIPKEDDVAAAGAPASAIPAPAARTVPSPRPREATASPGDRSSYYSPAVLKLAAERGVDLARVRGTGLGGRVRRKDVEAALAGSAADTAPAAASAPAAMPAPAEQDSSARPRTSAAATGPRAGRTVVTLSPTRKAIAAHLSRSNLEAPQAWTMVEADVTGLVRRRDRDAPLLEQAGVKVTLFHYFIEAVCRALRIVPALNARWEDGDLVRYASLDLGIAVAAESGLVVPVLRDAGSLSLEGIARGVADLAVRAHERRLRVEDVQGGTFTVNNTGTFGSVASKPIVNHPEVGIVTFERAVQRPVVRDDAIAVRWMANVCLSFDHRALDGLEAGRFLAALRSALEDE